MKLQKDEIRRKLLQRDKLMVLLLGGILLLVIAIPTGKKQKSGSAKPEAVTGKEISEEKSEEDTVWRQEEKYRKELEEQLEEILSRMAGVGKVEVMITMKSSQEYIVEKDSNYNKRNTTEKDASGGQREISQSEGSYTTIYDGERKDGEPFVVKTIYPSVEGVLVVAEGADSGRINNSISEIAKALFGIEAHKVKIVKRIPGE